MTTYRYLANSEDPSILLRWLSRDRTVVADLSSATWSLKLLDGPGGSTLLTKTSGITGYSALQATSPDDYNVLIQWASGELATTGLAGCTFSTRFRTLILQYTLAGRQSEPWNGDLTIIVEATPA